jgi:hypothetical protein
MKMHPIVSGVTRAVKIFRFGFRPIDEKLFSVTVGKNDTTITSWEKNQADALTKSPEKHGHHPEGDAHSAEI